MNPPFPHTPFNVYHTRLLKVGTVVEVAIASDQAGDTLICVFRVMREDSEPVQWRADECTRDPEAVIQTVEVESKLEL